MLTGAGGGNQTFAVGTVCMRGSSQSRHLRSVLKFAAGRQEKALFSNSPHFSKSVDGFFTSAQTVRGKVLLELICGLDFPIS